MKKRWIRTQVKTIRWLDDFKTDKERELEVIEAMKDQLTEFIPIKGTFDKNNDWQWVYAYKLMYV